MKSCKIWSKRQDNWKNYQYLFNQRKNLIFQCQCGKRYLSYPGLYLHFQRKHNQKISTNFEQELCDIAIQGQKTVYLYKVGEKQSNKDQFQKSETSQNKKSQISNVLSKFVKEFDGVHSNKERLRGVINKKKFVQEIIRNLQIFIQKILEQKVNSQILYEEKNQIISQIPNYLNYFMSQLAVPSGSLQYWKICEVLYLMSEWLRKQGYTNLILQFMQAPPYQC